MQTYLNRAAELVGPVVTGAADEDLGRQRAVVSVRDVSLDPLVPDWRGFGVTERPVEPDTDYRVDLLNGTVLDVTTDPPSDEASRLVPRTRVPTTPLSYQLSFSVHVDEPG